MSKSTLAGRQKKAVILIACAVVLLSVALAVVNYLVSIYEFVDTDGTEYTVKKQGGEYALFDENGYMLDTTIEDGKEYFVTDLGTQVAVSASGKATVYAAVDTADDEAASDYNRLMLFPKVESSAIRSLRVTNAHGTYTFEKKDGVTVLKGHEAVAYDQNSYAYLAGLCGSMVVMNNGRFSAEVIEKYGLDEYGLDEPQASFTLTSTSGKVYTVLVGDRIVSGNGYYVMLEGRETVYIVNSYYMMLLEPVESYVTPLLAYAANENNYPEVENFYVYEYTYDEEGKPSADMITALTYWPYEERENTEYQTQSYKMIDESLAAYIPESSAVTLTMEKLSALENASVVKLGVTDKALAEYGLDRPRTLLSYDFKSVSGNKTYYIKNRIWFSGETERGTHYVFSDSEISEDGKTYIPLMALDFILEVSRADLLFLNWGKVDWVEAYYFHINIMLMDTLEIDTPKGKMIFDFEIGRDDVEKITATMNGEARGINVRQFKELYRHMLYGVLFGEAERSEEELRALTENKDKWQLTYRVKTVATDKTSGIDNTYSFYQLGESESYLTVNGEGEFYVLTNSVDTTVDYAMKLWNGENIVE